MEQNALVQQASVMSVNPKTLRRQERRKEESKRPVEVAPADSVYRKHTYAV